ncbi:hypothetical protein ACIRBX_26455 [Kitasatospora sp. NPDC096147]|uniref:hypothetical protein n=1 Tax=Kitasatospora sp. NPDC096147 TaxID=3364093 RepID=UPI0037FDAB93
MSVNIDLHFTVSDLTDAAQAEAVAASIGDLLRDEGFENQITYGAVVENGVHRVTGASQFPIIVSGFGRWQPYFESSFAAAVAEAAPAATTDIDWGYPDDEY